MSERRRVIVLGSGRDIEAWRKVEGLSPREVIPVTPRGGRTALRGLSGDFEVQYLPSWEQASRDTRIEVDQNLTIIGKTGGVIKLYERTGRESRGE